MIKKGIILAGGLGTRMSPLTKAINKQLLPIYDKPLIYYPLSVLMLAGIREILIISTPYDLTSYKKLLGNGDKFGIKFEYAEQHSPNGLAQAFIIGEKFINNENVVLILGDNLFYGSGFSKILKKVALKKDTSTIFGIKVKDPQRYGVVNFNQSKEIISISEKPKHPKSEVAVTGLYFYDKDVVEIAKNIRPSSRGEYEITSVNNEYLKRNKLILEILPRGMAWLDTGTHETMMHASQFVYAFEERVGVKIACLEEIALNNNWISREQVLESIKQKSTNAYNIYLKKITDEN